MSSNNESRVSAWKTSSIERFWRSLWAQPAWITSAWFIWGASWGVNARKIKPLLVCHHESQVGTSWSLQPNRCNTTGPASFPTATIRSTSNPATQSAQHVSYNHPPYLSSGCLYTSSLPCASSSIPLHGEPLQKRYCTGFIRWDKFTIWWFCPVTALEQWRLPYIPSYWQPVDFSLRSITARSGLESISSRNKTSAYFHVPHCSSKTS